MRAPHGIHHTSLTVSDLDRSVAFYERALGLQVVMSQETRGGYLARITGYPDAHVRMAHLAVDGQGHRLELFQYLQPNGRRSPPAPNDVGITHVCLLVNDLQAIYDRLTEAGVSFYSEPVALESGVNKGGYALYLRDPDGITLELFQSPRSGAPSP